MLLSYSGQYKAFRHFKDIDNSNIRPLEFLRSTTIEMSVYPKMNLLYTDGCLAKTKDGKTVLYLANPSEKKEQLQYFYNNEWWYIELLPNTLATVVFED